MKRILLCLLATLLALASAAPVLAEEDPETLVTIVSAPDQTRAERPPCFPDPAANRSSPAPIPTSP